MGFGGNSVVYIETFFIYVYRRASSWNDILLTIASTHSRV